MNNIKRMLRARNLFTQTSFTRLVVLTLHFFVQGRLVSDEK